MKVILVMLTVIMAAMMFQLVAGVVFAVIELMADTWNKLEDLCNK